MRRKFIGFESVKSFKEKYIVKERPPENLIKTNKFGYERDNPSYDYLKHRIFENPYVRKEIIYLQPRSLTSRRGLRSPVYQDIAIPHPVC